MFTSSLFVEENVGAYFENKKENTILEILF